MIPCIGYAVASKKDERSRTEAAGGSTGQQEREVRARLASDADRTLTAFFKEDGFSGSKGDRGPQLAAAIRAAVRAADEHGHAELWAFTSSRFGRGSGLKGEARAVGALFYKLRDQGVALRTVADDEFVTNEMLIGFASKQASKYADDLKANVLRGKDDQFARGVWLGGPVPEGYIGVPVNERGRSRIRLRIDPDRQPVIARMFALAAEGWGQPTVAKKLREEGLRTAPRPRKDGTEKAAIPWTRRSVQNVLTNPVYAGGIVRHRGKPTQQINWDSDHADQTYLSREAWEALQTGFVSRDVAKKGRPQSGQPTRRYALAHIAECAMCGARMYATTSPYKRKDGTHARRYTCAGYSELCSAPPVDAEVVDGWIVDDLDSMTLDFDTWFAGITAADHDERGIAERELAEVQGARADLRRTICKLEAKVVQWIEAGEDARADAMTDVLARQQAEATRLDRAIENLGARLAVEPDHSAEVDAALDWWNTVRRQINGSKEQARSLGDVNDLLKELFTAFRLHKRDDGTIYVEPVLRLPDGVARQPWEGDPTMLVSDTFDAPTAAAHPVLLGNPRNTQQWFPLPEGMPLLVVEPPRRRGRRAQVRGR